MTDELIFFESEILTDDDGDAPVGTLADTPNNRKHKSKSALLEAKKDDEQPLVSEVESHPSAQNEMSSEQKQSIAEVADKNIKHAKESAQPIARKEETEYAQTDDVKPAEHKKAQKTADDNRINKNIDGKTAVKRENKPKAAHIAMNEDVSSIQETSHIRTSIKKLDKQNSVKNALSKTDFAISKDEQKPQTITVGKTKTKHSDPWANADVSKSTTRNGKSQYPAAKTKDTDSGNENNKKATGKTRSQIKNSYPYTEVKDMAKEATKTAKVKSSTEKETVAAKETKPATKAKTSEAKEAAKPATKAKSSEVKEKTVKETTKAEVQAVEEEANASHGKFVIKRTDADNFVFKLFSSNKRVVAVSAGQYTSLGACKNGIQSVINNSATAPIEDQTLKHVVEQKFPKWVVYLDKRGEFRLRLYATNGNMVAATNDGYLSKDAAKKGIDAISRAAKDAEVERNDDLW